MSDPELISRIRSALCDPDAPWYGSDVVPMVGDLCDAHSSALREIAALRSLADEAIDAVAEWAVYASDYFQQKHGLDTQLSEFRERLKESNR